MSKIAKIMLVVLIFLLTIGSFCGIYYGIQYHNIDKQVVEDDSGMIKMVKELQSTISILTAEKDQLNSEYERLQTENDALNSTNQRLEEEMANIQIQIEQLNNQIIYLNELLSAYERENKLIVTFYVKDTIHTFQVVEENECINPAEIITPTLDGHKFLYWSLDGQNEIDFSSTPITEDTSVYAVFESFTLFSGLKSITLGSKNSYEVDLNDYFDIDLSDRDISVQFKYVIASPYRENDGATLSLSQNNSFLAKNHYGTWATITLIDTTLYFKNEGYTDVFGSLSVTIYEIVAEK